MAARSRALRYCDDAFRKALSAGGHRREALVFGIIGNVIRSFDMRGMSSAARRKARFAFSYLFRRVMGGDVWRPTSEYRQHVGGFPIQTVVGLLSAFDAVEQMEQRGIFIHPRCLTTNGLENVHSQVVRVFGMSATVPDVMGGAYKVDYIERLRRDPDRKIGMPVKSKWQVSNERGTPQRETARTASCDELTFTSSSCRSTQCSTARATLTRSPSSPSRTAAPPRRTWPPTSSAPSAR